MLCGTFAKSTVGPRLQLVRPSNFQNNYPIVGDDKSNPQCGHVIRPQRNRIPIGNRVGVFAKNAQPLSKLSHDLVACVSAAQPKNLRVVRDVCFTLVPNEFQLAKGEMKFGIIE